MGSLEVSPMRIPELPRKLRPLIATFVCISGVLTATSHAIVNVHDEVWFYVSTSLPAQPQRTHLSVDFEGTLTAHDIDSGVTFSIVRPASESGDAVLLRYAINGLDLPAAGTPVNVSLSFALSCDAQDGLWVTHSYGLIAYCHPTRGSIGLGFKDVTNGQSHLVAGAGAGVFGLTAADENGHYGENPVPDGTFQCGGDTSLLWTEADALRAIERHQTTSPHLAKDGDSGWLGVYFDPAGEICQGTVLPGEPGMVYIVAKLRGLTACGFDGTEFRFTGLPDSWRVFPVPNPDMFVFGDPFGDGATMVFGSCQPPDTVLLYTVLVLATAAEENVEFRLEARDPPSSPVFRCPQILLCDAPFYNIVCAETVPCAVNSSTSRTCGPPVAVNAATWGEVKALYR